MDNNTELNSKNLAPGRRKYKCDHSYFNQIDSEDKAYWLGFIMADGNLTSGKQKVLTICLSVKDKQQLTDLLASLKSNHRIYEYDYKTPVAMIRIDSPEIHQALVFHGCPPKKTHLLKFPSLPNHLERHFIRGYLDGDGCICNGKTNKQVVFLGTTDMLEGISQRLPFSHNVNVTTQRNIGRLGIRLNNKRANLLYPWLYSDANLKLIRKERKLKEILRATTQHA